MTASDALKIYPYTCGAVSDSIHTEAEPHSAASVIIFTVLFTRAELPAP